jgi:hypothetical protein
MSVKIGQHMREVDALLESVTMAVINKKEIRKRFREDVFKRDGHRCRTCDKRPENGDEGLDAHHIFDRHDMPNGGYVPQNGISVCSDCHWKAEAEHRGEDPELGYSRAELFALIGTTFDEAWEASEKLAV